MKKKAQKLLEATDKLQRTIRALKDEIEDHSEKQNNLKKKRVLFKSIRASR